MIKSARMLFRILVSYQLKSKRILYSTISKRIVGFFGISYRFWLTINEYNQGEGTQVRRKEIDRNTSPNSIRSPDSIPIRRQEGGKFVYFIYLAFQDLLTAMVI